MKVCENETQCVLLTKGLFVLAPSGNLGEPSVRLAEVPVASLMAMRR